ncbi:5-oxoprolinase subunit PxpA [Anoxynatronum sibiricum]|uniref:5-oxoprolinase subunit PxpA n=1 Tax=Anoxynatronum sibiricum TaxID=210623 RepID=A0ABU9VNX9_9CLOT
MKIDINVDMGESFGRYTLGNDEAVMQYISSANIACGFHAGDPLVLEKTIKWAKQYNVAVGAHLGLPDRQGFGRREMKITPDELRTDTLYQIGAMEAFLKIHNMEMQHVKAHGILYRMVTEYEEYIDPFYQAIREYNPDLWIMLPPSAPAFERGKELGMKLAPEILIDLSYDDEGNWVIERTKKARTPEEVAERALMVAKEKKINTISGKVIEANGVTVCLHGDAPNAVEVAKKVNEVLRENNVIIANLNE